MRADFDLDTDRRGSPWGTTLRVLTFIGEAALVAGALVILYLAFRGPSGHPTAKAAPVTASPSAASGQGAATQPATIPGTTPPPTAAPTAAPSPSARPVTAGPFAAKAQSYLAGRRGSTEVAVYDLSTGQQWTLGPQAPQAEGSVVQLEILEAVLHQQSVRRTVLSLTQQNLAPPMIEESDTGAAATLWKDVGGVKGMRAFDHAARLVHTSPSWALTTTTPQDQITLLRQLAQPSPVLDRNDRKYARYLLENVMASQRWGVSGGVPSGVTVAGQNSWVPRGPGQSGGQASSIGWVTGPGRNYLMATLSTGNPSEQYGIDTLGHLSAIVWNSLAPRR